MQKKTIANRFGLIALLSLSLFASTAFAGNSPSPTQVVVTNTPAQPVPVVGVVKDADAPARKPFQSLKYLSVPPGGAGVTIASVPASQRIVLEEASGYCYNVTGVTLQSVDPVNGVQGFQFLPDDFTTKSSATTVRLYANPGEDLKIVGTNGGGSTGSCYIAVTGYYVNLP